MSSWGLRSPLDDPDEWVGWRVGGGRRVWIRKMGKDVPCRSRESSSLPTSPFSNLYFTIRNLAREYGRGARARGGESALQSWMVGLLEASGLRETVSCITKADRSAERSTVEVLLGARLVECKCIL